MKTVILILFVHFVSDFIFQTDKMAINKSKSMVWLSAHVLTYAVGLLSLGFFFGLTPSFFIWLTLNAFLHLVTDFITSRINSVLWQKEMRHWFFVGIGADQFIHACCLLETYEFLILNQ